MTRRIFKYILITLGLFTCGSIFMYYAHKEKKAAQTAAAPKKNSEFYRSLESPADFRAIQGAPLSDKFNDVQSVKIIYELKNASLYFINSSKYRYHYEFCDKVLGDHVPLEMFNTLNYGASSRREYVLADLNYFARSHLYTLEFVSEDQVSAGQIETVFKAIQEHAYMGDSLRLQIGSGYVMSLDNEGKIKLPKIYVSDIYKNQEYQRLNTGVSYGILKKVNDIEEDYTAVQPQDIIIVKGTPVHVPVCSGIITDIYQTPLSHINILCHNRDMPSAVSVNIWNNKSLDAYIGKPVRLSVNDDSFSITPATMDDVNGFLKTKLPKAVIKLKADVSVTHLLPARNFGLEQKNIIGNKAAGLGELYKIARKENSRFSVPEGAFAIPFYFYQQHIAQPAIQKEINELLRNSVYTTDAAAAHKQLKAVRKAIKEQPVSVALLDEIKQVIVNNNAGKSYRFRSSSNAEDMAGFSGAGLYDSKTGILDDTAKSIEKAIKNVWASTWNDEAYHERLWAGIDQRTIMMGILVHRNFPDESSNGVAITKNIYRPGFPGFTVNVQTDETSVVSPPDSVTCDQFICMNAGDINPMNRDVTADYLTYSNINKGKPVLTAAQVTQLYKALYAVKSFFYWNLAENTKPAFEDYALDIEFKFDKNGKLYLKQVRPYR